MQQQYISCALLLAQAVQDVLPGALRIQSANTDSSFGYDFLCPQKVDDQIIPQIQQKLFEKIKANKTFDVMTMMRENAVEFFLHHKLDIQAALAEAKSDNLIELGKIDEWFDLIQGAPLSNSNEIQHALVTDVRSFEVYYPILGFIPLLRVSGVVFPDKKALKEYQKNLEIAKKSDPVTLCRDLNLIDFTPETKEGMPLQPLWLPHGCVVRDLLIDEWKKRCRKFGFLMVSTPNIAPKKSVRRKISPLEEVAFSDEPPVVEWECEEELYGFSSKLETHRTLFKNHGFGRVAELIDKEFSCYSKDTLDLFRTKYSSGDVLRTFARPQDVEAELISSLQFIQEIDNLLALDFVFILRFAKETKEKESCIRALEKSGFKYQLRCEKLPLTGPRIEVHAKDVRGRLFLVSVVGIEEVSAELVVSTSSAYFSLERVVALLVEKDKGMLPVWLAPIQVCVLPVRKEHVQEAKKVLSELVEHTIRAEINDSDVGISSRMYDCHRKRVPFAVIIGDEEVREKMYTFRDLRSTRHESVKRELSEIVEHLKRGDK